MNLPQHTTSSIFGMADLKRKRGNSPELDTADISRKQHYGENVFNEASLVQIFEQYDVVGRRWALRDDQLQRIEVKAGEWLNEIHDDGMELARKSGPDMTLKVNKILEIASSIDRLRPTPPRLSALRAHLSAACWKHKIQIEMPLLLQATIETTDMALATRSSRTRISANNYVRSLREILARLGKECEYINMSLRSSVREVMRTIEAQLYVEPRNSILQPSLHPPAGIDRVLRMVLAQMQGHVHPLLIDNPIDPGQGEDVEMTL